MSQDQVPADYLIEAARQRVAEIVDWDATLGEILSRPGCPICGAEIGSWSLLGQEAHLKVDHTWRERWKLRRLHRQRLRDLLVARKYPRS